MSDPGYARLLALVGTADDAETLRGLRRQIHKLLEAMLPDLPVEQFYGKLNEAHDTIIRRTIVLAEAQLARMGHGSPPVPYAYLLFGSGGREEQTLSSDQDSGIVYEDPADESEGERAKRYFELFGEAAVELLKEAGYPPCEGNVISSNPEWRKSLAEWKERLNDWFREPEWEKVRYLIIVADCRLICGEERLLQALKEHFYSDMLDNPVIVRHMLNNTMRHKMLVGIFGQLLKEQYGEDAGSLDIKYGAYIPMVNAIRLMGIRAALRETSTLARIRALAERGKLTAEDADSYSETFRLFLRLRLLATAKEEDGMYANNGKLAKSKLSKELVEKLKQGLRVGKRLQRRVYRETTGKL